MKPILFVATLFFMFLGLQTEAQKISEFSRQNEEFLEELSSFMSDTRKKEGKEFIEKDFSPAFLAPTTTIAMQVKINKVCNLMLKAKLRAYPDFHEYLGAVIAFCASGENEDRFNEWTEINILLLEDKKLKKDFTSFVKNSGTLFKDKVFFSNQAVAWASSSSDYKFILDGKELRVEFPNLDLKCFAKGDSSIIYNTSGIFYPLKESWEGTGGRVTWQRADFDPLTTYAEFNDYDIRIKGSKFNIDSVLFYNEYFDAPLMGKLSEKVLADKTGDRASYPRFESYDQRLLIKDIFEHIDYIGGFTMSGNRLAGTGTVDNPAQLTIYRESEEFIISKSLEFTIRPNRISSQHASVSIALEDESISHPDIILTFDKATKILSLLKNDEGLSRGPYLNTYHNIEMYAEAIYWNIEDPMIELGTIRGTTENYAAFESKDYYKKLRYDALMGLSMTHPLVQIRDYGKVSGMDEFYASELAKYMRTSVEQLNKVLIDLANKGYVFYDIDTQYIIIKEKLHNTLYRNAGLKDYDVLQINSDVSVGNNGQINLLNNNLLLKGIRQINLSDSQDVTIYPSDGEIILKKNRDFKFGGRVWAGNFEFIGKDYLFNYDDFRIDLNEVDSCRIYVEDLDASPDMKGERPKIRIKNVLEDIAGSLKIDAPTNKSGINTEDYPGYPIFESTKNTYVYYDAKKIQGGVYDRDKFYYQIEPFTIDSLDNFDRYDLEFNGTLVSAGIFPDLNEPLTLMDDLSLGFDKSTGGSGLPIYGGKGKFTTDITLNYDGLQGAGDFSYLTTDASSDKFYFLPDQTKGLTTSYRNRESGSPEVPKVTGEVTELNFFAKEDRLEVSSIDSVLNFFDAEAFLSGTSVLTPQGMNGRGKMFFEEAELQSEFFNYERRKILADTSDFKLSTEELETLAFRTNNVNAEIDFDERVGEFKSNSGETTVEFPANQYICYMDEFKWFMDKDEMDLSSNRTAGSDLVIDTKGEKNISNFFSVNALQDSLNFLAPRAKYDIKSSIITCSDIQFITVADSKITPDSGKVVIYKKADMQTLKNALVVSNYITKFHNIFNAEIDINGRLDYVGQGDIVYEDEIKNKFVIHINDLFVDSLDQTVGKGVIKEEDEFALSPFFEYQGDFELQANKPNLTFDGGTRILHTCENLERNWYKFTAEIDPLDIYIPVDTNLRDLSMNKLGVGVILSDDTPIELYSTFLSTKKERKDSGLIEATGWLHYDKKNKKYQIGSKEKIQQANFPGNLIELSTDNCEIFGDGNIDLQVDFGLMKINNIGNIRNNITNNETDISGITQLDFFLDDAAMKHLIDQIQTWEGLNPINISKTSYEKSIRELLDKKEADKIIADLNLTGEFKKVPDEIQNTIFFGDVKYEWDVLEDSYVSKGALGIATMGKKQIFKYIKGKIEIAKGRSGDGFRMYLELDPANWYYFDYRSAGGIMTITTTDKVFTELIQKVKPDDRRLKEGKKVFVYQISASKKKRDDFVDRFPEFN